MEVVIGILILLFVAGFWFWMILGAVIVARQLEKYGAKHKKGLLYWSQQKRGKS